MTADPIAQILDALRPARFPLSGEKPLQAAIGAQLLTHGFDARREVTLAPGDIVDFMVDGIAIEVKIKGGKRNILRQCERYAAHPSVSALVLVTNVAMGFPTTLNGKPTAVLNLGRAWL